LSPGGGKWAIVLKNSMLAGSRVDRVEG